MLYIYILKWRGVEKGYGRDVLNASILNVLGLINGLINQTIYPAVCKTLAAVHKICWVGVAFLRNIITLGYLSYNSKLNVREVGNFHCVIKL